MGQVHQKLEAAGYRNVEKIEREHGVYEARATDRNGVRV
ncbi:PepSY domain-containing protein, partial [Accumulibacter sp.]